MRRTFSLAISGLLLSSALWQPAVADDLRKLFGIIAGEVIKKQLRQPQQQQQQQRARSQQQRRQQWAPQPQRQTIARQAEPRQPRMSLNIPWPFSAPWPRLVITKERSTASRDQATVGRSPTGKPRWMLRPPAIWCRGRSEPWSVSLLRLSPRRPLLLRPSPERPLHRWQPWR